MGFLRSRKMLASVCAVLIIMLFMSAFVLGGCGRRRAIAAALAQTNQQEEDAVSSSESEQTSSDTKNADDQDSSESVESKDSVQEEMESEDTLDESSDSESGEENGSEDTQGEESGVEVQEFSTNMPFVAAESGNIWGDTAYTDPVLVVGDDGAANQEARGYISFDISELAGSTIIKATLSANANTVNGKPFVTYGPILIKAVFWGATKLTSAAFNLDGVELANFESKNFVISNARIKNDLQSAVNGGSNRYQIMFYFEMAATDGDGEADALQYFLEDIVLNVEYTK